MSSPSRSPLELALVLFSLCLTVQGNSHCPERSGVVFKDSTTNDDPVDNSGVEFAFVFLENHGVEIPYYTVFVAPKGNAAATFSVEAPGISFSTNSSVAAGRVANVTVPRTLFNDSTPANARTIIVKSLDGVPIIVYGLSEENRTTDAFLALPNHPSLQTQTSFQFVVAMHTALSIDRFKGLIGIAAYNDDTEVTIKFKSGRQPCTILNLNLTRSDGEVASLSLNKYESAYIECDSDATGTFVESNKYISLTSGVQCSFLPRFPWQYCDHLIEQIPPVSTWGTRFVTVPLKYRTSFDVFRFIAGENCTTVNINCHNTGTLGYVKSIGFTLEEAEFETVDDLTATGHGTITSDDYCVVESNNRILVVQYSVGTAVDGVDGDPFMAIIPPVDRFFNRYTFVTPGSSIQLYTHTVNIVMQKSSFQPDFIILDGKPLSEWTKDFVEVPSGSNSYFTARVDIPEGSHRIYHSTPEGQFGISVYGFGYRNGYGYPGSFALEQFEIDPYNLRIDHSTDGEITITWEPPPGSNENFTYTVTLSDRNGCYSNVFTTNDTTLLICGLDSSKKYDAAVQPINVEGYNTTVITVSGNAILKAFTSVNVLATSAILMCEFQLPTTIPMLSCMVTCYRDQESDHVMAFNGSIPGTALSSQDNVTVQFRNLLSRTVYTCVAMAVSIQSGHINPLETHSLSLQVETSAESADIKIGANTLCEVTDLAPPLGVLITFLIVTLIIIAVLIILLVREKYRSCSKKVQPVNKETDEHVDFYAINGALRANRRGHYEFGSFSDPFIRSDSASALPECDIATTNSPLRFQDDENAINANEGDWIKLVGRTGRTSGMPSVI